MADYYVDENGKITTNKKKKKKQTTTDFIVDDNGKVTKTEDEDIAPVKKEIVLDPRPLVEKTASIIDKGFVTGKKIFNDIEQWVDENIPEETQKRFIEARMRQIRAEELQKEQEEKEKKTIFQKGAYEDGYQFGDFTKTVLGTVGDAGLNVVKGAVGLVEGALDLGAYGVAGLTGLASKGTEAMSSFYEKLGYDNVSDELDNFTNDIDDATDRIKKEAQADSTNRMFGGADKFLDKYSALGHYADAVTEGLGQVGGIILTGGLGASAGLGALGVTALTTGTTFATSMGSGMTEAYQSGATDEEATKYGFMKGLVDAGTELLFGGLGKSVKALGLSKGIGGLDDIFAKKLSSKISNQFFRNVTQFAVKSAGEGVEGVLGGLGSAVAKKLSYMSDEDIGDLIKDENLLEQFALEAVTSSFAQGGDFVRSVRKGTDFVQGHTKNEESVVNAVVEKRIAEQETDGKKLSTKEKNKIYDEVVEDFDKGYITTETIEEVLGGETYKTYKDTIDSETEAIKELEELYEGEELETAKKDILDNSKRWDIQKQLSEEVIKLASKGKDNRILMTYRDSAMRGETFTADVSKYDERQRATVQKAIDSGILNNTRRTHEFVDIIAKISADKGVSFDFTNNAKLKESGFAVEGKTVNGFVTDSGISINMDSKQAWQTTVGHEITHVLEGTEFYDVLQETVFEYAKGKNDYKQRLFDTRQLYKDVEGYQGVEGFKKIKNEVTADLVGEYLFNDTDFINNLSTKNRNVFQKVYDEIKYLCKVATAGSKEARQLEKVRKAFEDAYRNNGNAKADKTTYSLAMVEAVQPKTGKWNRTLTTEEAKTRFPKLWDVTADTSDVRNPTQISSTVKSYRKVYDYLKAEGFNGNILDASSGLGYGTKAGIEEYGFNVEDIEPYPDKDYNPKYKDYSTLDKKYDVVISNAVLNVLPQDQRDALVVKMGEMLNEGGRIFINVRGKDVDTLGNNSSNTNISPMEWFVDSTGSYQKGFTKRELVAYLQDALGDGFTVKPTNLFGAVSAIVTKDSNDVKYSLSAEQQEFFKDSKVRDEDGNLKVMYHGTSKGGHTVFDTFGESRFGLFGAGTYFTDSKNIAESYTDKGKGNNPQVYEAFLNIKNPMDMDAVGDYEAWKKAFPDARFFEGDTNEQFFRAMVANFRYEEYPVWEAKDTAMSVIESMGYDGITHIGGGRVNPDGERHRVYIAFYPEQIKNIDNLKPTDNADIRYSLSSDSEGNKLTKEQEKYFESSKMRDDNGNLTVMYHGSQDAGFHEFKQLFSDDNTSFFFVDNPQVAKSYSGTSETYTAQTFKTAEDFNRFFAEIGSDEYEVTETDGKFTLLEDGDEVATSDTAQGLYDEFRDWTGLGTGSANYKVYLNLKNPLIVDAKGRSWDRISSEFSQEVYDKYKTLTEDEKSALVDLAGWEDFGMFKSELQSAINSNTPDGFTMSLASAYKKLGEDVDMYSLFDIATDNFSEQSLKENAVIHLDTRNYSQKAKENGYDGVIFKNIVDTGAYASGLDRFASSTVAIAFESNQIKSVANPNPTEKADIRYSLSKDSEGRELSENQSKYFENVIPELKDENGSLKVLYHGTPNEFTQFNYDFIGSNGTALGKGFYLTDSKDIASGYVGKDGKIMELYANIEKPLSLTEKNITKAQYKKFVKAVDKATNGEYLTNYGEVDYEGYNAVLNRALNDYEYDDNDVDLIHSVFNAGGMSWEEGFRLLKNTLGYDGVVQQNFNGTGTNVFVPTLPEQIKSVTNQNPTDNPDINLSLSKEGEFAPLSKRGVSASDLKLETAPTETVEETVAPTTENVSAQETAKPDLPIADIAPSEPTVYDLIKERDELESKAYDEAKKADETKDYTAFMQMLNRHEELKVQIEEMQREENARQREALDSLTDEDAPPETEAPYYNEDGESLVPDDPLSDRNLEDVGNRKVKAYMYEHPEVKPFFQKYAEYMLGDLQNSTKGERVYNDELYWNTNGEQGWSGVKRQTTSEIESLLDDFHYTYAEIEKGLKAIIEDNGAENNACSKRIEIFLHDRLMNGYTSIDGYDLPPNQDYINLLNSQQIDEYYKREFNSYLESLGDSAVPADIAPVTESETTPIVEDVSPMKQAKAEIAPTYEVKTSKDGNIRGQQTFINPNGTPPTDNGKTARATTETQKPQTQKKRSLWSYVKEYGLDKGMVFEVLSKKTKNRELEAKWNTIRYAGAKAQHFMQKGTDKVKSLDSIRKEVADTGKTEEFFDYLYHKHNIDRMTLEERYDNTTNKAVFGDSVTADISKETVNRYEAENPEFVNFANDVYGYMTELRNMLVENGVISQETADLWSEMYPHYVPIHRDIESGLVINVPLDTRRTSVNNPIKRATGGNADILNLFNTMAERTVQTYKAIARNRFGIELKNTLNPAISKEKANIGVDEAINNVEFEDALLKEGKHGSTPTFTIFENGERVEFAITQEMYEALKPVSEGWSYTNKALNTISKIQKGLLTEYNPVFAVTNAIKDVQDVLLNSQHPARTYANLPNAYKEILTKGKWYKEYMENGGEQNTYFDNKTNTFKEKNLVRKIVGMPLDVISSANNFIEMSPRLAEYIASRKMGRSVDVSMLDASRVTTNFSAGGDFTKLLNRNGVTFLNASVQGAVQQARNIHEAKANGLKGWVSLATRFALAGLPTILLNNLLWDDDEEYEELSDYIKQDYYVVAKYGDGQFVRIPKGRAVSVIQNAVEQVSNAITGDDEVDFGNFFKLVVSNLAPNNPLDNNIIAPIVQVAKNETWYGEDLVPSRLQDLPSEERFDETTDSISKWLGETDIAKKLNLSPYQINYLFNQYSGGVGDMVLPTLTPKAERGDNSALGNIIAPFKDKFTTDSVLKNQNVSDFYEMKDELTVNANSSNATDEDILKSKLFNSINAELGELYAEKREIQNDSTLTDSEKYEQVREIQEQINDIARMTISDVDSVSVDENYATAGDLHFRLNKDGEWQKITDKQLEKQEEVTSGLGISASDYWNNKDEYDYAYEYPEKYAVSKAVGGYDSYKAYNSELYDIKADKDENGKSISGSRKEKVIDYINNLDIDYGEKIILFKSEYNADDTYNYEIVDYLNSREDISYSEMETILKELGFTVLSDGTVQWD